MCISFYYYSTPKREKNVKKVGEGVGWVGKCMGSIVANKRQRKAPPLSPWVERHQQWLYDFSFSMHIATIGLFWGNIEWARENKTETGGDQDVWSAGQNILKKRLNKPRCPTCWPKTRGQDSWTKEGLIGKSSQNLKNETLIWFVKENEKARNNINAQNISCPALYKSDYK